MVDDLARLIKLKIITLDSIKDLSIKAEVESKLNNIEK